MLWQGTAIMLQLRALTGKQQKPCWFGSSGELLPFVSLSAELAWCLTSAIWACWIAALSFADVWWVDVAVVAHERSTVVLRLSSSKSAAICLALHPICRFTVYQH